MNPSNALALPCTHTSHGIEWAKSRILGYEQNRVKRKLKEGIFIKTMEPQLNLSSGFKIKGNWKLEDKITKGTSIGENSPGPPIAEPILKKKKKRKKKSTF